MVIRILQNNKLMKLVYLYFLIIFLSLNLNAIKTIYNGSIIEVYNEANRWNTKWKSDGQTCTTVGQTRGYVATHEMDLEKNTNPFTPRINTSWNSDWGFFGCIRSNLFEVTPNTKDRYVVGGHYLEGELRILHVLEDDGSDRLCSYSGKAWKSARKFCEDNPGETFHSHRLNGDDEYEPGRPVYTHKIKSKADAALLGDSYPDTRIAHVDLKYIEGNELVDLKKRAFSVKCSELKERCKTRLGLCAFVWSPRLTHHLVKCLRIPFLPQPPKYYKYIHSTVKPRLLYNENIDFYNLKLLIGQGTSLMRCANRDIIYDGDTCSDGNLATPVNEPYKGRDFVIPFQKSEEYSSEVWFDSKKYTVKVNLEKIFLYDDSGKIVNSLPRIELKKPTLALDHTAGSDNITVKIVFEEPGMPEFNKKYSSTKTLWEYLSEDDVVKHNYGGNEFEFFRAKVDAAKDDLILRKKCIVADLTTLKPINSKKVTEEIKWRVKNDLYRKKAVRLKLVGDVDDVTEEERKRYYSYGKELDFEEYIIKGEKAKERTEKPIIEFNEKCDDLLKTPIPIEDSISCNDVVLNPGDDSCDAPTVSKKDVKVKRCEDGNYVLESDDCIISDIDYFDEEDGEYLCLNGYNPKSEKFIYDDGGEIEVRTYFDFYELDPRNELGLKKPVKNLDFESLSDKQRKAVTFSGVDIINIYYNGEYRYYRFMEKTGTIGSSRSEYSYFTESGNPIKITKYKKLRRYSPYKHNLCVKIPDKFR